MQELIPARSDEAICRLPLSSGNRTTEPLQSQTNKNSLEARGTRLEPPEGKVSAFLEWGRQGATM